jgi:hypothetical protein
MLLFQNEGLGDSSFEFIFYLWMAAGVGAEECNRSSQGVIVFLLDLEVLPAGASMVTVVVILVAGVVVVVALAVGAEMVVSFLSLGAPLDEMLAPANTVIQQTPTRKRNAPMAFRVAVHLAKAPPGGLS